MRYFERYVERRQEMWDELDHALMLHFGRSPGLIDQILDIFDKYR